MEKFAPRANPNEAFSAYGWTAAATMVEALEEHEGARRATR